MAKKKDAELNLNVQQDAVGEAASKFLRKRELVEEAKHDLDVASAALVGALRAAQRREIRVEGLLITITRVEAQDKIKVKKPQDK